MSEPARTRKKLAAYLRVSTDRQAEQGLGLELQEAGIKQWAKANGHRIVSWTRDEGVSGSNGLETRVGLAEALAAIRDKRAAGVVVLRLDRLARDLVLQEQLLAEVRRMGGEVFSTSAGEAAFLVDDPDDPSRALIRQILGAVAQYERAMIRLRLRSGRARKSENGGYAFGPPPLGYRAEGRELVADVDEQAVVARIRELRAESRSLREIAAALTAEGFRPKRSARWHPGTLGLIVNRIESTRD
jgi:DNA invertase Pin-like site-specific DNA recombinase